jgi:hypothetical protein
MSAATHHFSPEWRQCTGCRCGAATRSRSAPPAGTRPAPAPGAGRRSPWARHGSVATSEKTGLRLAAACAATITLGTRCSPTSVALQSSRHGSAVRLRRGSHDPSRLPIRTYQLERRRGGRGRYCNRWEPSAQWSLAGTRLEGRSAWSSFATGPSPPRAWFSIAMKPPGGCARCVGWPRPTRRAFAWSVPRFQSPLINPGMRFSRTRLSEILHRDAVGVAVYHATVPTSSYTPTGPGTCPLRCRLYTARLARRSGIWPCAACSTWTLSSPWGQLLSTPRRVRTTLPRPATGPQLIGLAAGPQRAPPAGVAATPLPWSPRTGCGHRCPRPCH